MLDFLQGFSIGSLLLFDLGYFSFPFFDTFTQRKMWWVSRYRENTSYSIAHVFYRHHEQLDALIWLGTGKKQARHLIRLARLGDGIGVRMYLMNICDPQMLSLGEVAQLYARRWDIEMAFRLLKEYLGMSHWWSSKQELILVQIWVVLILSHIVSADAVNGLRWRQIVTSLRYRYPFWSSCCLGFAALQRSSSNSSFKRAVIWVCCVRTHVSR